MASSTGRNINLNQSARIPDDVELEDSAKASDWIEILGEWAANEGGITRIHSDYLNAIKKVMVAQEEKICRLDVEKRELVALLQFGAKMRAAVGKARSAMASAVRTALKLVLADEFRSFNESLNYARAALHRSTEALTEYTGEYISGAFGEKYNEDHVEWVINRLDSIKQQNSAAIRNIESIIDDSSSGQNPPVQRLTVPAPVDSYYKEPWRSPSSDEITNPRFEAVWQAIKRWDINVPSIYVGYCGANGNHVTRIMDALHPVEDKLRSERIDNLLSRVGRLRRLPGSESSVAYNTAIDDVSAILNEERCS